MTVTEDDLRAARFMTIAEVALVLRVSRMTVYRLVHGGQLRVARVGRGFRVPELELRRYLREAFDQSADPAA
jgi:excisionase family DNA binding protein